MNSIQVQSMQTPYGYEEQHLMIDGVFLPYYVDAYAKASKEGYFRDSTSLLGLYPAWGKDLQQELCSGILHLESYTEEDWEKYGDNIALEQPRSEAWKRWISENWDEELFRRRMNGTLLYYQNEKHIVWLKEPGWVFDREAYESCVEIYRRNLPEEKIHF